MARFTATIDTPRPIDSVFAYLADFSNAREWDPGIARAERLDDGPVGVGARFRLVSAPVLGRALELTYEIVEHRPPSRVVLGGGNERIRSLDTITLAAHDGRTRLTYDADLGLDGPVKPLQGLLWLVLPRIARRAVGGLREVLDGEVVRSD